MYQMLAFTDRHGNRSRMFFTPTPRVVRNGVVRNITRVYVHTGYGYADVNLHMADMQSELRAVWAGARFLDMPDLRRMAMVLSAYSEVLGQDNIQIIYFCY